MLSAGYWENEKGTKDAFGEGGWFRTGDLATVGTDGYLRVVDRKKDMVGTNDRRAQLGIPYVIRSILARSLFSVHALLAEAHSFSTVCDSLTVCSSLRVFPADKNTSDSENS